MLCSCVAFKLAFSPSIWFVVTYNSQTLHKDKFTVLQLRHNQCSIPFRRGGQLCYLGTIGVCSHPHSH